MTRASMKLSIFSLFLLAACGTKTPLTKPTGPATPPIFGAAAQPIVQSNSATAPPSNSATAPQSSSPTAPQSNSATAPAPRDDNNKPVAVAS